MKIVPSLLFAAALLGSSATGEERIVVTFKNNLSDPVSLFWINTDSNQEQELNYPPIPKGGSCEETTFVGHRFLGKTEGGKTVGDFTVKEANQVFTFGSADSATPAAGLLGKYEAAEPSNDWHYVTIEPGADGKLLWKNKAGVVWTLEFRQNNELWSAKDCPYGELKYEIKKDDAGKITGLEVGGGFFRLVDANTLHAWKYGHEKDWPLKGDPKVQSPIEVPEKGGEEQLPAHYEESEVKSVENNGHAFQLNYADAGGVLETDEKKFRLAQFHFHSPSEHVQTGYEGWVDEKGNKFSGHYAMEVHFVHTDGSFKGDDKAAPQRQDLAVVGVFIKEGAHNAALQKIWDECPATKGVDTSLAFDGFNASELMPKGGNFQTYTGSLTTPPLSSGVSWFVMDDPIEASREQIMKFRAAMKHNTNRSIQGRLSSRIER